MTQDEYKEIVWEAFRRTNSRPGHILFMRTFRFGVMRSMNPVEEKEFIDMINQMIGEELITYEPGNGGMDLLRLTEKGYDHLYGCKTDSQIAELIMNEFRKGNYRENQIIPMRNFNFNFIPRLNPKEQDRFADVVNKLIDVGFVSYKDATQGHIEGLVLQQAGYDYIYGVSQASLDVLFNN